MKGKISVPLLTKDDKSKCEDDNGIYLLYEYIDGTTVGSSELTEKQVQQLAKIIATLHSYNDKMPVNTKTIREDFSLPFLNQLKQVLLKECASLPMDIKGLLGAHIKPLEQSIDRVEGLSEILRQSNPKMVLCHTDIHNWNLMQRDEQLVLIDWEGLKLAPVEADLMFFVDKSYYDVFMNICLKLHKDFVINTDALLFYHIRRKLEDIWEFIEQLLYDNQEDKRKKEYVLLLLENNPSVEDFERIPLTPISWSWSGSAVPMYSAWIEYLESLLPSLIGLKWIKHKKYIETKIDYLSKR